jgi:acetoacetyl-CoA synthetase
MTGSAPPILWTPSADEASATNLAAYMTWLERTHGRRFQGYEELWRWSVDDLEGFWATIWEYYGVEARRPFERVLGERSMPGATWFPGSELNYAEHVLRGGEPGDVAIVHESETRAAGSLTWSELRQLVAEIAGGLRSLGVQPGDRVAAYLPNIPETVAALLAVTSIGAVWSCCSPDFGARAVVDRFAQIDPVVLLAVDGYRYGGRDFDRLDVVAHLGHELESLRATVVLDYLDPSGDRSAVPRAMTWEQLLAEGRGTPLEFEPVPFDHPLWILYSSGTTGLPKAIVHGHGGILLEHLKHLGLHVDARPGDRAFWFTTTGWMMWNFLVGALLGNAAIVLYDGSPATPDLGALWDLAERTRITCFGTSAAFIMSSAKAGVSPREGRDLSSLRAVGSTGSPLPAEGFDWVYDEVGDVWLFSTSGGTDVCTAFLCGCPILPVYRGEIQTRALGAKVEAWTSDGRSVVDEVGELVLTEPLPSMPIRFWSDPGGVRLRESYFAMFPGVWRHGDWVEITSRGTAIITGRSDATINRAGIRMGTSEIYSAVLSLEAVEDALVVDVPRADGRSELLLFVVLRGGDLDESLREEIKACIRRDCSPRHVPDAIYRAPAVPRTLSGKLLEIPVKRILMGQDPGKVSSRDALADPDALDWFARFARN